jgi:branched-chain amino acid aminotransferase
LLTPVARQNEQNHTQTISTLQFEVRRAWRAVPSPRVEGMRVWVNGSLLDDPEAAAIRVSDHGLTVGDGVFEAVKVVEDQPFALGLHLKRLQRSASGLGLPDVDEAAVRDGIKAVLAEGGLTLGRLRITYTGGPAPMGSGRGEEPPTVIVAAAAMTAWPPTASVAVVPWPRNERGALAGLKTTSYAENVVALAEAKRRGAGEAVFANLAGHLCEGTGSNVFYVVDGELRTPTLASGCLAGVTRGLILEWVGGREVDEPIEVVEQASEVFLASTTRDVQAVARWDDRELEAPGPLTAEALATWRRREPELLGI